ncbi:MAG: carbamoyltransferase HypF [Isosphaeraceae bacterium]|nr:carbamoyltransferase HypF [Isosphaeraceae bacterium]
MVESEHLARRIEIRGCVQGVGFRPFVVRAATRLGVRGRVRNESGCVRIHAEGTAETLERFRVVLAEELPPASSIESISDSPAELVGYRSFAVEASATAEPPRIRVPKDLAVCENCLAELADPSNRRHAHAFITCTDCGPRYSLIQELPFDRSATSMSRFGVCFACAEEYSDVDDRRFHGETISCRECGPQLRYASMTQSTAAEGDPALAAAIETIRGGGIVAVRGIGGYQLVCRADDAAVVMLLRSRKNRPTKPFAVMVRDVDEARRHVWVSSEEAMILRSRENPIVLLERVASREVDGRAIVDAAAPHSAALGLMLPTSPLHRLLIDGVGSPLVVTSGNRGDEPLALDDAEAERDLAPMVDGFLHHDRPILRAVDDSVVRWIDGAAVPIRAARGYAPISLPEIEAMLGKRRDAPPAMLALGGHQKSSIALWTGSQAVLSQHLGDLETLAARTHFDRAIRDLTRLYGCRPMSYVHDEHPEYHSTRWARTRGVDAVTVQHHHAHAVSAMVDHGLLEREVLAIVWDGSGYGSDGTTWGGETLRCTATAYRRVASLRPIALAGGEAAIRRPHRIAAALLLDALGHEAIMESPQLLEHLGLTFGRFESITSLIHGRLHTPWASSVGRLFDGVAALILGEAAAETTHEAEAAMMLESIVDASITDAYRIPHSLDPLPALGSGDPSIPRGDWRIMISTIVNDLMRGVPPGVMATRFHNALAEWAMRVASGERIGEVLLSGGCFQNRYLTERTLDLLRSAGKSARGPRSIPPGDGGLAAGQLAVVLARRT